jgi:hypothetical protein
MGDWCRVKVLCMWYNLTVQLNRKIEMLGQILIGRIPFTLQILLNEI